MPDLTSNIHFSKASTHVEKAQELCIISFWAASVSIGNYHFTLHNNNQPSTRILDSQNQYCGLPFHYRHQASVGSASYIQELIALSSGRTLFLTAPCHSGDVKLFHPVYHGGRCQASKNTMFDENYFGTNELCWFSGTETSPSVWQA